MICSIIFSVITTLLMGLIYSEIITVKLKSGQFGNSNNVRVNEVINFVWIS